MLGSSDNNSSVPTTSTQTSKEDKSYFAPPPAISLPKGGGAIKGMGEKFAANPVTGTGSMSVPIATTPGRSGFGPQLSLSYDSGSGNGIFGMGWSLALPAVTRKTDKGLPRYGDGEESDVFILSGAEDLVPILKAGKFDEIDRDGYRIRKYRPRIEGLFARIERWTKLDSGEIHWRSISKDNITTLYGKTDESRIADPENLTHVFSYLICESYDDKGNAIHYRYKSEDKENSVGIDLAQAHEGNRTPKSRSSNRYLKRIYYGNQTPHKANEDLNNRQDWMFEVVFDHGEHDSLNPIPKEPEQWTTATLRKDPFSSYRSGFEVRTYRLCQRVLMFHHIPDMQDGTQGYDGLVRSTDLTYTYSQDLADERKPVYSFLKLATQTGYQRNGAGYLKKSLPPLEFTYSEPIIDERVWEVDRQSLENLPQGLDGTRYQWVDLEGEGLSGILTEQGGGWFYKRNLSPINPTTADAKRVEAQFAAVGVVKTKPASGLGNGSQFMDLAGDGQPDVVTLRGMTPGFYERTQDERWDSFVAFKSLPNLDWDNPNLKFIDLDGDGHSDILVTEDNCFVWYPSLAEDGFGAAMRVSQPWDEEKGARVVFADGTESIHLADMSGDGLTDIVRIRNGDVCYWPNLGYGRFGSKVAMDSAPWFDRSDIFNQRRILLADIDGSGTTDILYLCAEGVQIYFNQSGNSYSAKQLLKSFPAIDSSVSVTTLDLLGNGTACLVWSSPLLGSVPRVMRYIDLMGGQKPHLLVKTVNNMGSETIVHYAPSTRFYLEDERKGTPWITKLPFLVHVVERVETYDRISGNRFVSRSAYHHGYFDGVEREFRGFGMVEQWDTEEIGTIDPNNSSSIGTNLDTASFIPPVHTKTWFHTGVYVDRDQISNFFAKHEYYREPQDRVPANANEVEHQVIEARFMASLLPDTILPSGLTAQEEREAVRSLKGQILRQEVYALDGSDKEEHPYSVSERNYAIRVEQGIQTNRHGVFFTHDRETIDYHYERNPNDPRVSHAMTLEVDEFGNGLKSVAIAYPRRQPAFPEQGITHITYTENWIEHEPDRVDWYRIGVPIETRTYELTGYSPTGNRFQIADFVRPDPDDLGKFIHLFDRELNYEDRPTNGKERRPIEWVRSLYRPNSQANTLDPISLALGTFESLALPCESFKLAFTPGLLAQIYGTNNGNKIPTNEIAIRLGDEGKYRQLDGNWWIPSGRQQFAADRFFIVTKTKDPFGHEYAVTYDDYALLTFQTTDPLNNTVEVKNDYRVMQPQRIIDPNQNQVAVAFDILGMVAGTAVLGKVNPAGISESGDSLDGFVTDLSQEQLRDFRRSPSTFGSGLLGKATTRIIYDLESFQTAQQPLFAATIARENHVNSANGNPSIVQVSFSYSDGFGREIQKKIQAESGDAPQRESNAANLDRPGNLVLENGELKMLPTDPRWVGNGRTIFNNKGKPVKQYEPFFSSTHLYEDESELVMTGVTPMMFYDPAGRVVATLHPNHTFEKVLFDPWRQETWDVNDTVSIDDPKTDLDVGGYFKRLLDREYLPTWYSQFSTSANPIEKDAAQKALAHAGTPAIAHLDTLGRTFLTIADNGAAGKYETLVELDLEGNTIVVTDHRKNAVMIYAVVAKDGDGKLIKDGDKPRIVGRAFDLLGHNLYSYSMDAGDRWMLNNVAGKPIRAWNDRRTRSDLPASPKGHVMETAYDALQRPTHLYVQPNGGAKILVERLVYGENHPDALRFNLKGQPFQHYDGAGVVSNGEFDFKGNLLRGSRQLAKEYKQLVNWMVLANLTDIPQLIQAATAQLEPKTFDSSTTFDAMNRPIALTAPDRSIIHPIHNKANLLEKVEVQLRGAAARTVFVKDINYDAKGQRQSIEYGNDATNQGVVKTEYRYDSETFRLIMLKTTRKFDGARLQDLNYTYDPVGNITTIQDAAQQKIYFNGEVVSPSTQYTYDPLYRLITAAGREHIGQTTNQPPETKPSLKPQYDSNDWTRRNLPHLNQAEAMRNYTESYEYDGVGNILAMIHQAAGGAWTRRYDYEATNNRLRTTSLPGDGDDVKLLPSRYSYDEHGNMTRMPHLPLMRWDFKDQLQATSQQVRNDGGTPEITYFVYDAGGQRVRKVTEAQAAAGQIPQRMKERMYLGGFEVYREYNGDVTTPTLERETLHIMDDKRRIALVETKIVDVKDPVVGNPLPVIRYQLDNHLGSASLELDGAGQVISYEEYYPYGSTSYQAGPNVAEVSLKRYRYTGMERDDETGLAYHSARYYAAWLGRWCSCDPIGIEDGLNIYIYGRCNPIQNIDPLGTDCIDKLVTGGSGLETVCFDESPSSVPVASMSGSSGIQSKASPASAAPKPAPNKQTPKPEPKVDDMPFLKDYLEANYQLHNPTPKSLIPIMGGLQLVGGTLEAGVGGVGGIATAETGVGLAAGSFLFFHGLDNASSGWTMMTEGKASSTYVFRAGSGLASYATDDKKLQNAVGQSFDFTGNVVSMGLSLKMPTVSMATLESNAGKLTNYAGMAGDLAEVTQYRAEYLIANQSNRARGPVLTGTTDTLTGQQFFGQNTGVPSNLHPVLAQRLALDTSLFGDAQLDWLGASGGHSEMNALNEGLWARTALTGQPAEAMSDSVLGEFLIQNIFLRGQRQMSVVPRCFHCGSLTRGSITIGSF